MRNYRNFFSTKEQNDKSVKKSTLKKDAEGRVHVAFYTDLFTKVSGRFIATNSEYANLKDDIMDSIEPYSTKENIVLTVYETEESSEFGRESTFIGFQKYLKGCAATRMRSIWRRIAIFGFFLLLGVAIEVLIYASPAVETYVPLWVRKTVDVLAGLFIWQFGGFLSFELPGEIHNIRKYRQIINRITFEFKRFE